MTRFSLRILSLLAVLGLAAAPALASKAPAHGVLSVRDDAGVYSTAGVNAAKAALEGVEFKAHTNVTVHTVKDKDVPAGKRADFDAVKKDRAKLHGFVQAWARDLAAADGSKPDIYALILVNDSNAFNIAAITNKQASVHRHFGDSQVSTLEKDLGAGFKTVLEKKLSGDEAKKERDEALLTAAKFVIAELKETTVPDAAGRTAAHGGESVKTEKGSGIMGYVCIGLCVLLGIMLVRGLIAAFSGGGGGGGMGGGGYGGGGGGGFMSSMLGGMFGAAAGMYMYDNFFGGHSHSSNDLGASGSSYDNGGGGGGYDTGADDYSGGSAGAGDGGGDFGGGNDDMGGGGDWGGGGDAGGGDFGGGDW